MKRRDFLRSAAATVTAVVVGPACGGDSNGGSGGAAVDGGSNDTSADTTADVVVDPGPPVDVTRFPQSVASGDPGPGSVILWTRVEAGGGDIALQLEVSTDENMGALAELEVEAELIARAEQDHCVKVKVEGLEANTHYYYRFLLEVDGETVGSRVGRTKTAPDTESDVPVRFAVVSCQDYIGKHYSSYQRLALEEVDFVVHLGDYIYETTGDADFQASGAERSVSFTDTEGAITFYPGTEGEYQAAQSLSNYRELYKIYRADPHLQAAHERFPFVCVWDDHEFSDDCYGAVATYSENPDPGPDEPRRRNANQAWSEYMPVDLPNQPDFIYDPMVALPKDITIYRDLRFGKHVHLAMTDLRSYRADHLIDEMAWPGSVAAPADALEAAGLDAPERSGPYVEDIANFAEGIYAGIFDPETVPADGVSGAVSASYINDRIAELSEADDGAELPPVIDEDTLATLPVGIAYHHMGKSGMGSSLGARYLILQKPFDVYAKMLWDQSGGDRQTILGAGQRDWLLQTLGESDATWKVWGNEYTLTPRRADISTLDFVPEFLRGKFLLSGEDWDGMPDRRDDLVSALSEIGGVVAVTGDIHAFFAGLPWDERDPTKRIVEFVTAGVSSAPYRTLLMNTAAGDPALAAAGAVALAASAEQWLMDKINRPNPNLTYSDLESNGFMILEADGEAIHATYYAAEETVADTPVEGDITSLFSETRFRVAASTTDLEREGESGWATWDTETVSWSDE
ncbi:MAG: alkaline phosphatase [Deltaproteobacteria bacterium]|nr:alkaline phosphatase [Deltaproteobacteria bacterium]